MPAVCVLDPDGDIVRRLKATGQARRSPTGLAITRNFIRFALGGEAVGIIGCAVGAPFAVLVAEELFACGCELLISMTSAGQIAPAGKPPYFVVIDRALARRRNELSLRRPVRLQRGRPAAGRPVDARL